MKLKRIASLSLDLDNKWSYLKTHGDPGWESFPSYLDLVVPRILDLFSQRGLRITIFVVGQDAALRKNHTALRSIADAGHEVGNHSFRHEPWLHAYTEPELEDEIARAEAHIEEATGRRPVGFRGPGFSLSEATLRVLARRGYLYDCTTFPNLLNPLARAYYLARTRMSQEERHRRRALFGSWRDGLRPVKPYRWRLEKGMLTEIPVTTMPLLKIPMHFSYLLYLHTFSPAAARAYFETALAACRVTRTSPSLLLHPLDFMGRDDDPELAFFPAMRSRSAEKIAFLARLVDSLTKSYRIITIEEHAAALAADPRRVPVRQPQFRVAT